MGRKKETDVFRHLADWIQELKFNPKTRQWECRLKPNRIIIFNELDDVKSELERHVVKELIELIAEAIGEDPSILSFQRKFRQITDFRVIICGIITESFPSIRQNTVIELIGWQNHSSFSTQKKLIELPEIRKKIEKVYRAYPSLRQGRVEIIDQP